MAFVSVVSQGHPDFLPEREDKLNYGIWNDFFCPCYHVHLDCNIPTAKTEFVRAWVMAKVLGKPPTDYGSWNTFIENNFS
jgi:hypothetical protein